MSGLTIYLSINNDVSNKEVLLPLDEQCGRVEGEVKTDTILKTINKYINQQLKDIPPTFFRIYIKYNERQVSLRSLGDKTLDNLQKDSNGNFKIEVLLRKLDRQRTVQNQIEQINHQITNINNQVTKIKENLVSKVDDMNDDQKKSCDLMYLYGEPLVRFDSNQYIAQNPQVSYLKEYCNFLSTFIDKALRRNIKIKMKVGNKSNIEKALQKGVNVLHFSCHGQDNQLFLESNCDVERGDKIGQLWKLTTSKLIEMLKDKQVKSRPSLIIFNSCHSSKMAKEVNQKLKITTIGYNKAAMNQHCEELTKLFYSENFRRLNQKLSIRQIMESIKQKVGDKFKQRCQLYLVEGRVDQPLFKQSKIAEDTQSQLIFNQPLQQEQYFGIKKQLFLLIKELCSFQKKIKYLFGKKSTGKSTLIKQAVRYMKERQTIDHYQIFDFKQTPIIYSTFMVELQLKQNIAKKLNEFDGKKIIIVFDHCQQVLKYDQNFFIEYVKDNVLKKVKFGKIIVVIVSDLQKYNPIFILNKTDIIQKNQYKLTKDEFAKLFQKIKQKSQKLDGIQLFAAFKKYQQFKYPFTPTQIVDVFNKVKSQNQIVQKLERAIQQQKIKKQKQCCELKINLLDQIKSLEKGVKINKDKIQQIDKYLKWFIYKEFYKHNQFDFPIVSFVEVNQTQKKQNFQSRDDMFRFWEKQIKGLFYQIKIQVEKPIPIDIRSHPSYEIYKNLITQTIKTLFILMEKANTFTFIILKNIQLKQQMILFFVIIQRIKYKYKIQIEQNLQLASLIRSHKVKLLLSSYCLMKNIRLQIDTIDRDRIINSLIKQLKNLNSSKFFQDTYGQQQQQIINITLKIHKDVMLIQQMKIQFGDGIGQQFQQHNYPNELSNLDQCARKIENYYKLIQNLNEYRNNSISIQFLSQWQIRMLELLGLKLIKVLLSNNNRYNLKNTILQIIKKKVSYIGDLLHNHFRNRINEYKDKSFGFLYQKYTRGYVQAKMKLESLNKQTTIPLTVYDQLKSKCKEAKLFSLLQLIKDYIKQNFSNSCIILISSPLGYSYTSRNQTICEQYINIYRSQCKFSSKIKQIYEKIPRDIYAKINELSQRRIYDMTKNSNLMMLLCCDVKNIKVNHQCRDYYLIMEDPTTGKSNPKPLADVKFPIFTIVIAAGVNAELLKDKFIKKNNDNRINNQGSVFFISINKQQQIGQNKKLVNIQHYYNQIMHEKVFNSYLQYFYQNFCQALFTGTYHTLKSQIQTAFQVAKLQSRIDTKILYNNSDYIQYINQLNESTNLYKNLIENNQPSIKMKKGKSIVDNCGLDKYINNEEKQLVDLYLDIGYNQQLIDCITKLNSPYYNQIIIKCNKKQCYQVFIRMLLQKISKYEMFKNGVQIIDAETFGKEHSYSKKMLSEQNQQKLFIFTKYKKIFFNELTKKISKGNKILIIAQGQQIDNNQLQNNVINLEKQQSLKQKSILLVQNIVQLSNQCPEKSISAILTNQKLSNMIKDNNCHIRSQQHQSLKKKITEKNLQKKKSGKAKK